MKEIERKYNWIPNSVRGLCVGILSGIFITIFANTIYYAGVINKKYTYLFLLLPLGAALISFIYRRTGERNKQATVYAIDQIHIQQKRRENNLAASQNVDNVSPIMGLIGYLTATVSHLLGASVGKEGVGVQIGLSAGAMLDKAEDRLSEILGIKDSDSTAYYMMSGASAAFGSLFGSPIAGVLFGLQFASPDILRLDALLPCAIASFSATYITKLMGAHIMHIPSLVPLQFNIWNLLIVLFFSFLTGFLVKGFCICIEKCKKLSGQRYNKVSSTGSVVISSLLIVCVLLINLYFGKNLDYNGLSTELLYNAISSQVSWYAFFIKALLILLSILAGFVGGEVVPLLVTGATFGYLFASIFSLPTSAFATLGALAMLSGGTNLPLVCFALGLELFHYNEPWLLFVAVTASYTASGKSGIYAHQRNIINT